MKDFDYGKLNPGIVKTVRWLRENGFTTCDSGDGETVEHECDLGIPYVHIRVAPSLLVGKADKLKRMLENEFKIQFVPLWDGNDRPFIEAHYSPVDGYATISLFNVKL